MYLSHRLAGDAMAPSFPSFLYAVHARRVRSASVHSSGRISTPHGQVLVCWPASVPRL
jgi:hypothetical protein